MDTLNLSITFDENVVAHASLQAALVTYLETANLGKESSITFDNGAPMTRDQSGRFVTTEQEAST